MPNGVVMIINTHKKIEEWESDEDSIYNKENTVIQLMMEYRAIAICDAAVDDNTMARYQKVSNGYNDVIIDDYIGTNKQHFNGAKSTEALTLLQVVYYIYTIIIGMTIGSIVVITDQKLWLMK